MPATDREASRHVPTRLGRLHVRIVGDGPDAVLLPSMFVDAHTFDPLIPYLGGARRLVLIDGPGLGRSEPLARSSSVAEAADAVRDALQELDVAGPVDLIGNAFGGHIGYRLASDPGLLRSLVAISAPPEPPDIVLATRASLAVMALLGRGPIIRPIAAKLLTPASLRDPAVRRVVRDGLLTPTRGSLRHAIRSFVIGRSDARGELRDIRVPTRYVIGDRPGNWDLRSAEAAAAATPGAKLSVIPGASTLVPLEQPAALARVILDFWGSVG